MAFVVSPTDIAAEQARLLAGLQAVQAQVSACSALDVTVVAGWNAFYAAASTFCGFTPKTIVWPWDTNAIWATATAGDIVVAYEKELGAWQTKLTATGCKPTAPSFTQYESTPLVGSSLTALLEVGAVAVGVVAGAYAVKEITGMVIAALPPKKVLKK